MTAVQGGWAAPRELRPVNVAGSHTEKEFCVQEEMRTSRARPALTKTRLRRTLNMMALKSLEGTPNAEGSIFRSAQPARSAPLIAGFESLAPRLPARKTRTSGKSSSPIATTIMTDARSNNAFRPGSARKDSTNPDGKVMLRAGCQSLLQKVSSSSLYVMLPQIKQSGDVFLKNRGGTICWSDFSKIGPPFNLSTIGVVEFTFQGGSSTLLLAPISFLVHGRSIRFSISPL